MFFAPNVHRRTRSLHPLLFVPTLSLYWFRLFVFSFLRPKGFNASLNFEIHLQPFKFDGIHVSLVSPSLEPIKVGQAIVYSVTVWLVVDRLLIVFSMTNVVV
ncbi:hypothetical protein MtrunA17_Chr8g0376801 [Medicago truncatula]|uniref:Transmembrane protein n=1 Tax=Medicago truncatula TaxID=3880 RepID=A0A396GN13_MEDTR|nr:hypothetical protein MtrunA17_Chr8g0376801 [Medicago truncatula]